MQESISLSMLLCLTMKDSALGKESYLFYISYRHRKT